MGSPVLSCWAAYDPFESKNMRTLALLSALLFTSVAIADEHATYSKAYNAAKANDTKIMVVFSTIGCVPCANLKYDIKSTPEIKFVADNYEVVFVNASKQMTTTEKKIFEQAQVRKFPTTVTINVDTMQYGKKLQGYSKQSFKSTFKNTQNLVAKPSANPSYRSKSKPSWNLSGSWVKVYDRAALSNHLETTHGMDSKFLESLTINQLFALHDDDHEGKFKKKVEPYCPPGQS